MYANKIAAITDPDERQRFIDARVAEQSLDFDLVGLASRLVVDAVVRPQDLRANLIARLADAKGWERSGNHRHHPVWPV